MIELEGVYFRIAWVVSYLVISAFGLVYYAPRMRSAWVGDPMEEKYTSKLASCIGIIVGAATFTVIFISQIEKIDFFNEIPFFVVFSAAFMIFAGVMSIFSFCVWKPGRRR
ncbi:hypothetical protein [Pseudomonas sp. B21-053]|uniref:hypothetical protein n=1 Tax=Pseudomonas sp. B21-053 TaxID=2895493 RepID=UPI00222E5FBA|nr:hypothetical protein [Pseudomonas sp. B21-053]UZE09648.1 hypothetical protein LOY68_19250 [Pseudomonas sp. B21-053]